jgi:hypothetical protein
MNGAEAVCQPPNNRLQRTVRHKVPRHHVSAPPLNRNVRRTWSLTEHTLSSRF